MPSSVRLGVRPQGGLDALVFLRCDAVLSKKLSGDRGSLRSYRERFRFHGGYIYIVAWLGTAARALQKPADTCDRLSRTARMCSGPGPAAAADNLRSSLGPFTRKASEAHSIGSPGPAAMLSIPTLTRVWIDDNRLAGSALEFADKRTDKLRLRAVNAPQQPPVSACRETPRSEPASRHARYVAHPYR